MIGTYQEMVMSARHADGQEVACIKNSVYQPWQNWILYPREIIRQQQTHTTLPYITPVLNTLSLTFKQKILKKPVDLPFVCCSTVCTVSIVWNCILNLNVVNAKIPLLKYSLETLLLRYEFPNKKYLSLPWTEIRSLFKLLG